MGRIQPVAPAAEFSAWEPAMLDRTAGFGQDRTLNVRSQLRVLAKRDMNNCRSIHVRAGTGQKIFGNCTFFMKIDISLIERWLAGRSLARGLPLPIHQGGGLRVDVGSPGELRRHVFLDAGAALQDCAAQNHAPYIFLKAAIEPEVMRAALSPQWKIEAIGYLMCGPAEMMGKAELPPSYRIVLETEHGGQVARIVHASSKTAAVGRVAFHAGCAVFDQIMTEEGHRRLGLGTLVMLTLNTLAERAGVTERLLVATEEGANYTKRLGWHVAAPWSTAVLPVN
jgi:GNAT superfamily N-acetyltransferase